MFHGLPMMQQEQANQTGGDVELLKALLLLVQMLSSQSQGQEQSMMPRQQGFSQMQLPQASSQLAGMFGRKGNMYGQLADMFRDIAMPNRRTS